MIYTRPLQSEVDEYDTSRFSENMHSSSTRRGVLRGGQRFRFDAQVVDVEATLDGSRDVVPE
jgi:hypothetical protein